jgi:N-methylhydantoinase B
VTTLIRTDPVTVEIIRNALNSSADDMNAALIRSAYTPIIYEGGDCVVALLDDQHQVLGQSAGLPIFLGNLERCTQAREERFGREIWQPGDVWILNDSYLGGTHLNDVTIFGPVFVGETLVGFTASRAHWIDVGSKDPGGSMDSVSIFQEGLRMGPQKLVDGGRDVVAVMDTVATNVRFPYPTSGDMHAMIACITMGQTRLQELVQRFGLETLRAARDEIFDQTEQLERAVIARIPDGVYTAEGVLDNDGIDLDTPIPIKLKITVDGDCIDFDVTESADQTVGPVNCGVSQAVSALRVGYKLLVSPDVAGNGGSFRPMTTRIRQGSVLGAVAPAACQWYPVRVHGGVAGSGRTRAAVCSVPAASGCRAGSRLARSPREAARLRCRPDRPPAPGRRPSSPWCRCGAATAPSHRGTAARPRACIKRAVGASPGRH